jgi:transcriptional regulator of met regulon
MLPKVAWNQGVDVYADRTNRLIVTLKLIAIQLLTDQRQGTSVNNLNSTDLYETWKICYNHCHARMGLSLPNTYQLFTTKVKRHGMNDWNTFYETMTHAGAE